VFQDLGLVFDVELAYNVLISPLRDTSKVMCRV